MGVLKMKYPKAIYRCETYWFMTQAQKPTRDHMTKFKYNKILYANCIEYISWWQNPKGKWIPTKIYLEKGNILWEQWEQYQKTGKQPDMTEFEEW